VRFLKLSLVRGYEEDIVHVAEIYLVQVAINSQRKVAEFYGIVREVQATA
jgi:hypothetical protein